MYPLTCPDGKTHVLPATAEDKGPDTRLCENCPVTEKEYNLARDRRNKFASMMDEIVRAASGDPELVAEALFVGFSNQHRTCQQDFVRMLALLISKIATLSTDPRNEAAVMWCKKVAEIDSYFPRI